MSIIKRNALVPHTQRQMFELVNSIEEYPRFLPWCNKAHILERTDNQVEATIEIAWSGIHKQFTTRNVLSPHHLIDITLVRGPFRHLEGKWSFTSIGDHACKVHLDLEFELAGGIFDAVFLPIFNRIANSLVDAFCKRAGEIYGNS